MWCPELLYLHAEPGLAEHQALQPVVGGQRAVGGAQGPPAGRAGGARGAQGRQTAQTHGTSVGYTGIKPDYYYAGLIPEYLLTKIILEIELNN